MAAMALVLAILLMRIGYHALWLRAEKKNKKVSHGALVVMMLFAVLVPLLIAVACFLGIGLVTPVG